MTDFSDTEVEDFDSDDDEFETPQPTMSEARSARREARATAREVVSLTQGVSGLSAEQKRARLQAALEAAESTVSNLQRALAAS